jgi:hypothetical protein
MDETRELAAYGYCPHCGSVGLCRTPDREVMCYALHYFPMDAAIDKVQARRLRASLGRRKAIR